jgi:hypothetical protein
MRARWVFGIACAATLGCASTLAPGGARVRDSDGNEVEGCKCLGDFSGPRKATGWADKDRIRSVAAAKGATDIVWGVSTTTVTGTAYVCP